MVPLLLPCQSVSPSSVTLSPTPSYHAINVVSSKWESEPALLALSERSQDLLRHELSSPGNMKGLSNFLEDKSLDAEQPNHPKVSKSHTLYEEGSLPGSVEKSISTNELSAQLSLTEVENNASLLASEPVNSASGGSESNSLESLAVLDSTSGENRVGFILTINKVPVKLLWDTGAKSSYMSKGYATKNKVNTFKNSKPPLVHGVWGQPYQCDKLAHFSFKLGGLNFSQACRVAPLSNYDIILGMDWINRHALSTNWTTGSWTLRNNRGETTMVNPSSIKAPAVKQHFINGVGEVPEDEVPLGRGL